MQLRKAGLIALLIAATIHCAGAVAFAQKTKRKPAVSPVPSGIDRGAVEIAPAPSKPRTALVGQPRMDGSTTAILLGQLLAARSLGLKGQVVRMPRESRWEGAASSAAVVFPLDTPPAALAQYQSWQVREPRYSGTNGAYMSLINGAADLILVAREPSIDELNAAREKGVQLDARAIALDAFVFLVNTENPVSSLTLEQLRGIYTMPEGASEGTREGAIKNWNQVGGGDGAIRAFTRNRNSGSEELMEKLVMQGRRIIYGGERMHSSMMGPIEGVSRDTNSIAYSVYYYEHIMSPYAKNKLLAINGIAPTAENIGNRTYPLVGELYVVTRQGIAQDTPAAQVRDWLMTEEGQKLIAESGYVPLKAPAAATQSAVANTP